LEDEQISEADPRDLSVRLSHVFVPKYRFRILTGDVAERWNKTFGRSVREAATPVDAACPFGEFTAGSRQLERLPLGLLGRTRNVANGVPTSPEGWPLHPATPNVRGWPVLLEGDDTRRTIHDLIVDTHQHKVWYIVISPLETRARLLPNAYVRVDNGAENVAAEGLPGNDIVALPLFVTCVCPPPSPRPSIDTESGQGSMNPWLVRAGCSTVGYRQRGIAFVA
jgi:hypothetical protein